MVVIKTREELIEYVSRGYKPYLMKSVNRWYLRRAQERHIIARELEEDARKIASMLEENRRPSIPAGLVQKMRWDDATIKEIVKEINLGRSTIYSAFEREPEELVKPRQPMCAADMSAIEGKPEAKPIQERSKTKEADQEDWFGQVLSEAQKGLEIFWKAMSNLSMKPDIADKIPKIIATGAGLLALNLPLDEHVKNEIVKRICIMWNTENKDAKKQ